jgi:exo-beta-1,3-glucanase (GH17 family)
MIKWLALFAFLFTLSSCNSEDKLPVEAEEILGNSDYPAIAYGGYRNQDRSKAPSVEDIKEDLTILSAAGFRILRTYHARLYEHAPRLLQAIKEMKEADANFEMYVMLGAWMQCENAFTENFDHSKGDRLNNRAEIEKAIVLAQQYPDIVKVIAVGNEAMVHWAASYYVEPGIILKWVNYLQGLKKEGTLGSKLWITSSDNFASWGGGDESYFKDDLDLLLNAVDYVSLHSYPFHDTHYDPDFWYVPENEEVLSTKEQSDTAVARCVSRLKLQYKAVKEYMSSREIAKEIHIGESGWASYTNAMYGAEGSHAADEYKQMRYYKALHQWTNANAISCFYFEAFDEPWKDGKNPGGSENHFGLFGVNGEVKMPLWGKFDQGIFKGLSRNGHALYKTYQGKRERVLKELLAPPYQRMMPVMEINYPQNDSSTAETRSLLVLGTSVDGLSPAEFRYPSDNLKLDAWENTCKLALKQDSILFIETGTGPWWGCALSYASGASQNHGKFKDGKLVLSIRGNSESTFALGLQSGTYSKGDLQEGYFKFGPDTNKKIKTEWQTFSLDFNDLEGDINWEDVSALLYVKGLDQFDGGTLDIKNISYSRN